MRRVPYDSLLRQASLSYPSAQLKRNAYGGMVGWPHWHVIIWGRLVVNWILEKVFSLLDSVFLSFLRWGKNFPLFGELLLTTTDMLTNKNIEAFDKWIERAKNLNIPEINSFINGVERDMEAVRNAIKYEYSNGLVEGCINKLKVIKRIMYGRCSFETLKTKILQLEKMRLFN